MPGMPRQMLQAVVTEDDIERIDEGSSARQVSVARTSGMARACRPGK
jgi:hypothetical protein